MIKIDVLFPLREYSGRNEIGKTEKIPSPNKLISSFLSTSCRDEEFLQALKYLEGERPIILQDSDKGRSRIPSTFQYKKMNSDKDIKKSLVDQSNILFGGPRTGLNSIVSYDKSVVYKHNPIVTYIYDVGLSDNQEDFIVEQLSKESGKIGYLGRSFNSVVITVEKIHEIPVDERFRYVPSPRGEGLFVPFSGYIDYMIQRYDSNYSASNNLPFHLMNKTYYFPLQVRSDGRIFTTIMIPSIKDNWGERFSRIQSKFNKPIIPLISKGKHLYGLSAEIENDMIADFVIEIMDNFGENIIQDDSYRIERYVDEYSVWTSYTPVLLRGNSALAEAKVIADVMNQTGLSIKDIDVVLSPILYNKNQYPQPYRSKKEFYEWSVSITLSSPIQGPIIVGEYTDYGYGRMIHND